MRVIVAAALVATLATFQPVLTSPATGREHFEAYDGPNSIQTGQGGTRITKNGIDYWTSGTPPRRYQVLGIIVDKRGLGRLAGDPIGSKSVAEAVQAQGGDAIIFMGSDSHINGFMSGATATAYGNTATGFGWSAPVGQREAELEVIKYLPDTSQP